MRPGVRWSWSELDRRVEEIASGPEYGGGPIESFYRIVTRRPMATELEPSLTATVVQSLDYGIEAVLGVQLRRRLTDY